MAISPVTLKKTIPIMVLTKSPCEVFFITKFAFSVFNEMVSSVIGAICTYDKKNTRCSPESVQICFS